MSDPSAIPEDVMKAAATAFLAFSPSPTAFDAFNTALIVEAIARAIMTERERAAKIADEAAAECAEAKNAHPIGSRLRADNHAAEGVSVLIAAAIRKGTP